MSWRKIRMKFPGTCTVCNGSIPANEVGLWAKGLGVKHEGCAEAKELRCAVCGKPAGCPQCEFRDGCDLESVSPLCICRGCADGGNAIREYQKSAKRKFPLLGAG